VALLIRAVAAAAARAEEASAGRELILGRLTLNGTKETPTAVMTK
jgi:hypothetical protein